MFRASFLRNATAAACGGALALGLVVSPPAVTEGAHRPAEKGEGWAVLAPVSYKNLTIFPVRGRDLASAADYVTLDEGLRRGTVVVGERGGVELVRRPMRHPSPNRPARQENISARRGDGATVNELVLINKSGKKLLLLAGEVVVGGKQDRIVQEDRLVPAVSVPVALDVFCVEQGRWQHNASSGSGRAGQNRTAAAPQEGGGFGSLGAISHPKLRAAAQDRKEQGAVWSEVRANNAKLGTTNSTETYQEVYASKRVTTRLDDYVRALEREVSQPGVVGVVVARNGELVWADLFAGRALFAAYWPKLLKSYAVDALGDYRSEGTPSIGEARRYLAEREGTTAVGGQPGVYQLVKTEHPRYAVFELKDLSLVAPLRLHFNKMERKRSEVGGQRSVQE